MFEIFQYDFMVRAFIAGLIIAILAPSIGIFLVVKRYSLLADALSHVSLVGVASGVLFNFNPIIGALIASIIAAFGIEKLRSGRKIFGESVLALFLSGSLAIALVLLGFSNSLNASIFNYLFGSITTVTRIDVIIIGIAGVIVITLMLMFFKQFFLVAYDEEMAQASRLHIGILNVLMIVMAAVVVSISMRVVGALLVGALMVIPVLSAFQFGYSFVKTAFLGVVLSLVSVIMGLIASFYLNLPSGGTIVIVALLLFGLSLVMNRK